MTLENGRLLIGSDLFFYPFGQQPDGEDQLDHGKHADRVEDGLELGCQDGAEALDEVGQAGQQQGDSSEFGDVAGADHQDTGQEQVQGEEQAPNDLDRLVGAEEQADKRVERTLAQRSGILRVADQQQRDEMVEQVEALHDGHGQAGEGRHQVPGWH